MDAFGRRELLARGGRLALAAGVAAAFPVGTGTAGVDQRLRELRRELNGNVVLPGDASYPEARLLWNPRFDAISRPLALAYPTSIEDVRRVVRWATKHDVHFVTRSGGHSYGGWSTTRGVVVDLSRLSAVRPHPDGTAQIGAGARLGDVQAKLWSAGRTIPVGTCPSVGISGLTLCGGHGFSSRALGLACDNVVGLEVVTADAELRHCDAKRDADLFWALRGAGAGSFGIVTKLVFRTQPVANVTTVNVQWPWSDVRTVWQTWQAYAPAAPDALSCTLAIRAGITPGDPPRIGFNGQVFGTKEEATALIAPLVGVGSPTRVAVVVRPFIGAVSYFAGAEPDTRRSYKARSNYATRPMTDDGIDTLVGSIEAINGDPRLAGAEVLAFAHGGAINRVSHGDTAYVHRNAVCSLRYASFWAADAPADTNDANLRWIDGIHDAMAPNVSPEAVQSYADPGLAEWASAYYGSNLPRLVAVKRAYDPDNVFRYPQSIPTAL